ncbi:MAG TPA: hypothetical protein VIX17_03965 [Pyrinomonadaceae bacterium]|jgi:hypothetical protein
MSWKQRVLLTLQIVCAVGLVFLPFIDKDLANQYGEEDIRKHLLSLIARHKVFIGISAGSFAALVPLLKDVLYPRQKNKEMRTKIMDTMLEELFDGNRQEVRITVFTDAGPWRRLWIFLRQLYRNVRARTWKLPPRGNYIYIKERRGNEFPNSKTFLYYSPDTRKKCHGVAGLVRQSLEEIVVKNLPDLDHIDLKKLDMTNKRKDDVKKVRRYMEESHLRDLEPLMRINKLARHIYGNILENQEGIPKGVLVIDSWQQNCPFDNPGVMTKLSYYLTLFSPTM